MNTKDNDQQLKMIMRAEEKYFLIEPLFGHYFSSAGKRREYAQEVCVKLGISQRTLRRYIQKTRDNGAVYLVRKQRSDAGMLRKISPGLVKKALALLYENSKRSVSMLIKLLGADDEFQFQAQNLKTSTLYYHLKKAGYDFQAAGKENSSKIYHRFEADYAHQLWQGDARHGIPLPNPQDISKTRMTYLFAWIDDFSRKILYASYYWDEKLPRLEDSFRHAVLRWGLPEKCYCDNGACYISAVFTLLVTSLGIRKIHHPPYQAHCKGKVEAVMKAIKQFQNEAGMAGFKTIEELNSALWAWIEVEYNSKLHSSTGETPDNRFRNSLNLHPPKRITDLEAFNSLFLFKEERTINKYGQIRFNNNFYKVHDLPIGEIVEIRYDPFDISSVQLFHQGKFIRLLQAYKLTQKSISSMPEEKKNIALVSKHAQVYFSKIREKHMQMQKECPDKLQFFRLKEDKKDDRQN